jgi:hypothetical protein
MNNIRDKLPDMKARLNTLMGQAQQELDTFGDEAIYGDTNQARSLRASDPSSALIAQPRRNSKAHSSSGS